jgi:hypothetical protein
MQWKEMTLRAKWLWTTWAYLAAVLVIVLEVLFIVFTGVFIIPKYQKLVHDGMLDRVAFDQEGVGWMHTFLVRFGRLAEPNLLYFLVPGALWGLFEWRVRSENKPFMRLSALGTAGVGLLIVIVLALGSLVISFCLGMPAMGRMARPYAREQVAAIDTAVKTLEQALAKKDWEGMQEQANRASEAMNRLASGPAVPALTFWNERPTADELRERLNTAQEDLREAQQAIGEKQAGKVETALQRFGQSFEPLRAAAKRQSK